MRIGKPKIYIDNKSRKRELYDLIIQDVRMLLGGDITPDKARKSADRMILLIRLFLENNLKT